MGSMNRRLGLLENRSRESAAAEVRRAWQCLTDEEMARLVAPFHYGREPTPEELAAQEAFERQWPEDLIARAIGRREGMDEDEIGRRMGELMAPVLERRRSGVAPILAKLANEQRGA